MNINTAYEPLVKRLIDVDNYDKMKSILDIGFSGIEVIEKYYATKLYNANDSMYKEEVNVLQEKIEKMRLNMDELYEKHSNEKQQIRNRYEDKIKNACSEMEKSLKELQDEYFNYKKQSTDMLIQEKNKETENLQKAIKEFNEKLDKQREDKQQEINILRETLEKQQGLYKDMLCEEKEKIEIEKQKIIDELIEENEKYKNKYEKINMNSVLRGKGYEDALEYELKEFFEKNQNAYSLVRYTGKKGKGDFLITNNYSGVRIMLEAKNMKSVSSTVEAQQPKFLKDVRDKTNNYDGGLIVATGKIEGRKNYQFEILEDGKVICFVENYLLNNPENINLILEMMHQKIKEIKNKKVLSREQLLKIQVDLYKMADESFRKSKALYDTQKKIVTNLKLKILELFNVDVDEYMDTNKKTEEELNKSIKTDVSKFIQNEIKNNNVNKTLLKSKATEKFKEYIELYKTDKVNGISKNTITSIIKNELSNIEKSKEENIDMKEIV